MIKKLTLLIFSLSVIFISTSQVSAEEITYKKIDGVYYNQWVNGQLKSNGVTMFYFGNTLAYCIEPGVSILDRNYNSSKDWSGVEFSENQKSMMEKIGYYGYEYPGHQSPEYYLASQELIWNVSNPNVKVSWSSGKNNTGNVYDYSKQKQEILDLIEKDKIRPSFTDTLVTGEAGTSLTLTDDNNVLENYTLSESTNHKLTIDGNKLIIDFNKEKKDKEKITLTRKNYDNQVLIVYTKDANQKMATLRFSSPITASFEIENTITPEVPEIVKVPDTAANNNYLLKVLYIIIGVFSAKKMF